MDVLGTVMKLTRVSRMHTALPLTSGSVLGPVSPCFVLHGLPSLLKPPQISHKLCPHRGTGELTPMALSPRPSALGESEPHLPPF